MAVRINRLQSEVAKTALKRLGISAYTNDTGNALWLRGHDDIDGLLDLVYVSELQFMCTDGL